MIVGQRDPRIAQLRRGVLEFCVMALLEQEERYGFDLVRELASWDGMRTGEGTIYPLLGRLRRDGLLESRWRESPTGPPRRRPSWREWTVVVLLGTGALMMQVYVVLGPLAWIAEVLLVATSQVWTARDKVVAILAFPIAEVAILLLIRASPVGIVPIA